MSQRGASRALKGKQYWVEAQSTRYCEQPVRQNVYSLIDMQTSSLIHIK